MKKIVIITFSLFITNAFSITEKEKYEEAKRDILELVKKLEDSLKEIEID